MILPFFLDLRLQNEAIYKEAITLSEKQVTPKCLKYFRKTSTSNLQLLQAVQQRVLLQRPILFYRNLVMF